MIALGGPKLKRNVANLVSRISPVSMIALGGPKLKPEEPDADDGVSASFNDSTGWA